jgi:hypothetical protein
MKSKLFIQVLAVGIALLLAGAAWALEGLDGMVGFWKFEDGVGVVATDSSGLGNNGLLVGSASFTSDPEMGGVLQINDFAGEMRVPHNANLEPEVGTLMVWVKPTKGQVSDIVSKNTTTLIRQGKTYGAYAYLLRITNHGSAVAIITNDDPAAEYPWTYLEGPRGRIKRGQWTHLAARWNGSTLSLFMDGKLVVTKPYTPVPGSGLSYAGNTELKVGAAIWDFGDGWLEFSGQLSDLRLYGRDLSESEIAAVYASRAPKGRK